MNDWLWAELHDLFDTDDGSLPEVRVEFADKRAVITAFAELRGRGQDVTHRGSTFRSVTDAVPGRKFRAAANPILKLAKPKT
jgi:hypothetical protein